MAKHDLTNNDDKEKFIKFFNIAYGDWSNKIPLKSGVPYDDNYDEGESVSKFKTIFANRFIHYGKSSKSETRRGRYFNEYLLKGNVRFEKEELDAFLEYVKDVTGVEVEFDTFMSMTSDEFIKALNFNKEAVVDPYGIKSLISEYNHGERISLEVDTGKTEFKIAVRPDEKYIEPGSITPKEKRLNVRSEIDLQSFEIEVGSTYVVKGKPSKKPFKKEVTRNYISMLCLDDLYRFNGKDYAGVIWTQKEKDGDIYPLNYSEKIKFASITEDESLDYHILVLISYKRILTSNLFKRLDRLEKADYPTYLVTPEIMLEIINSFKAEASKKNFPCQYGITHIQMVNSDFY